MAKTYLPSLQIAGVTAALVEKYLQPLTVAQRPESKADIYCRILESAQNANMKAGVVGGSIDGGVRALGKVLFDFNAAKVLEIYHDNWKLVLRHIVKDLNPRGEIRRKPRSIWPHYCQTILSGASFVEQFTSHQEFYRWVEFFDKDDRARASLPLLISQEIDGFGFPLACDFLKELGYVNFPKADVHLRAIFVGLALCPKSPSDYELFKAIIRVAKNAGVTPYNADKVFWLIGSGKFDNHPEVGKNGKIGRHKVAFIKYARSQLIRS